MPFQIIGDTAYPLLPWLTKNYIYTVNMKKDEDSFNAYMNGARVTVEIAFGRLKGRWRRLQKKIEIKVAFVPKLVAACCTLHNVVESRESSFRKEWLEPTKDARKLQKQYPQPDPQIFEEEFDNDEPEEAVAEAERIRDALKEHLKKFPQKTSLKWHYR